MLLLMLTPIGSSISGRPAIKEVSVRGPSPPSLSAASPWKRPSTPLVSATNCSLCQICLLSNPKIVSYLWITTSRLVQHWWHTACYPHHRFVWVYTPMHDKCALDKTTLIVSHHKPWPISTWKWFKILLLRTAILRSLLQWCYIYPFAWSYEIGPLFWSRIFANSVAKHFTDKSNWANTSLSLAQHTSLWMASVQPVGWCCYFD